MKSLAEQSTKATSEVAQQISSIQNATEESVSAIREITQTISRVSEISSMVAVAVEEQGSLDTANCSQRPTGVRGNKHGCREHQRCRKRIQRDRRRLSRGAVCGSAPSAQSQRLKSEVGTFLMTVRGA